jgi:hypothetical protein
MIAIDALPPALQAEYALLYEARAIHDTASLQLAAYGLPLRPAWIVADVKPAPGSGSAMVPGASIQAETGRFVNPGGPAVLMKHGEWQAVATASPSLTAAASYSWTEPLDPRPRVLTPEHLYSPFAYGGTIVFTPQPAAQGLQQFGACRLLFPEWGRLAADALRGGTRLSDLFARAASDKTSLVEVARLATADDGFTATLAFRTLLAAPVAMSHRAGTLFQAAEVRVLSTFVYLSLIAASVDRSAWTAEVEKLVSETNASDRLLAIAYGSFAVTLFANRDAAAMTAARQILGALRKRVQVLGIPLREHSPWLLIFDKSGFT